MPRFSERGRVEGLEEAMKMLQQLPSIATQRNALRRSLKPAAVIYRNKMHDLAPEREGNLKASIHIDEKAKPSKSQAKARRKAGDKSVEMHVIADDVAAVQNEYGNSRMAAQPFGIPAYDATKGQMISTTADAAKREIGGAIERAARKAAKRG